MSTDKRISKNQADAGKFRPCRYCGQRILKIAIRCHHCGTALTLLAKLERISTATVLGATIATIIGAGFTVMSALDVKSDKAATEQIKKNLEQIRSEASHTHVRSLHQNMNNAANEWRRCKALQQPDCNLLSAKFISDAHNAIDALKHAQPMLNEDHKKFLQQIMCVGLRITHDDGKARGLYDSATDHRDASAVDEVEDFIRGCPAYVLQRQSAHPVISDIRN